MGQTDAGQGFYVHLVEKEAALGGLASDLYYTIDNVDVSSVDGGFNFNIRNGVNTNIHGGVNINIHGNN